MNKQAFNARAKTGRALARIAASMGNAWARDQALEYARSGWIGPDLQGYLDWYWGRSEDLPQTPMGAMGVHHAG